METCLPSGVRIAIVIPVRMGSVRFPGKPLVEIDGFPMVGHVWRSACRAHIGDVFVACCEDVVYEAVTSLGGVCVMTDSALPSGTDRVFSAIDLIEKDPDFIGDRYDIVVNLQGDVPFLCPSSVSLCVQSLFFCTDADIATLCAPLCAEEYDDENIVKFCAAPQELSGFSLGSLYDAVDFKRYVSAGESGLFFHHIGIYAYRRDSLSRFCSFGSSLRECSAGLEQLRALDNGMRIVGCLIDKAPLSVDTPEDLDVLIASRQA